MTQETMTVAAGAPDDLPAPRILVHRFLTYMRMNNNSPRTVEQWDYTLRRFLRWLSEHGIDSLAEVTPEVLAAYRRHLYHYRNPRTNRAIKFATQTMYLVSVRRLFVWLEKEQILADNRGAKLEIPKEEERLPCDVLTASEVETVLNTTDITTPLGLRDRAILETFYTTAMRCSELCNLDVYDLSAERGVIAIRQGKGGKDRVVPVGERARSWIAKYLADVRPDPVTHSNETVLFVTKNGYRFHRNHMSYVVRRDFDKAGITRRGSCHMIRHSTATLMLEGGSDLRSLQLLLGHKRLNTTQLYTHVAIERLKEVHAKTHPARPDTKPPAVPPSADPPASPSAE